MTAVTATAELQGLDDLELSRRAANHDTRAFEALMRRHNRLLYRTARSILRDDHDAEDCVQEAYLQAYRSLDGFRGEAKLSTWLVRIVINRALEALRRRRSDRGHMQLDNVVHIDEVASPAGGIEYPEASAMREELRQLIERRIDCLPDPFRTVFVLRAVEDLNVDETATCLGIPPATVRTRYFRARSLLRESIERDMDLAVGDAFSFAGARCDRIVAAVLERLRASPDCPP
jgi:RNA polymerase sigma-70 factor (ECF subfamily)